MAEPDVRRLDDAAVEPRLARLDAVLGQLEQMPGRTAELALEAVELLTEVYGEALARVVDLAVPGGGLQDRLTRDELLRHLLLLHRIHPDPVDRRVARALEDLQAQLRSRSAQAQLLEVRGGVATVGLASHSCGCRGEALHDLIRQHVLTIAPELSGVDVVDSRPAPTLIPLAAVSRRPAGAAGEAQPRRPAGTAAGSHDVPEERVHPPERPLVLGGPA
jgi:hypothetical protein